LGIRPHPPSFAWQPAQPVTPFGPVNRAAPFTLSFCLCQVDPACQPLPYPHLPSQHTQPGQRRRSRRTRSREAGRGRAAQPARTPRSGACARDWMRPRGKVFDASAPSHRASEADPSTTASATCPARRQAKGIEGFFPRAARGVVSKGAGRCGTEAKPSTPPFGVSSSATPVCTGVREGAGAPPPRRAGRGRSRGPDRGQGPLHRRDAVDTPGRRRAAPEGGSREPTGDKEQEPRRTTTGVNLYLAFVHLSAEPATTPPPPRSEQHRGHPISFLPP
jgi:hypothetical protein